METATLKIDGYKETQVSIFCITGNVKILTGYVQKERGKKFYHVTVQYFGNGVARVYTIEQSINNIQHTNFKLN